MKYFEFEAYCPGKICYGTMMQAQSRLQAEVSFKKEYEVYSGGKKAKKIITKEITKDKFEKGFS